MAESMRPRFAVDLDEIERQLANAHPAPASHPSGRHDPLAELARIVGQDDPFQSILSADRAPRPSHREPAGYDDIYAAHEARGTRGSGQELHDPYLGSASDPRVVQVPE